MNGFFLILPLLLIRYGVLPLVSREGFRRAAFFPPTVGIERVAYWVSLVTTIPMMFVFFLYKVKLYGVLGYAGLAVYIAGGVFYLISILQYSRPNTEGLNTDGLYRVSRNPMYTAFFLYFLGAVMFTRSWPALVLLLVSQAAMHFLILSEERWCIERFKTAYTDYMKRVRRYL